MVIRGRKHQIPHQLLYIKEEPFLKLHQTKQNLIERSKVFDCKLNFPVDIIIFIEDNIPSIKGIPKSLGIQFLQRLLEPGLIRLQICSVTYLQNMPEK